MFKPRFNIPANTAFTTSDTNGYYVYVTTQTVSNPKRNKRGVYWFFEGFDDGEFTSQYAWSVDLGSWSINSNLRAVVDDAGGTGQLTDANGFEINKVFTVMADVIFNGVGQPNNDMFVKFNGGNGYDFYASVNGTDGFARWRRTVSGTPTNLITELAATVITAQDTITLRTDGNGSGGFTFFVDRNNTGFVIQGTAADHTYITTRTSVTLEGQFGTANDIQFDNIKYYYPVGGWTAGAKEGQGVAA